MGAVWSTWVMVFDTKLLHPGHCRTPLDVVTRIWILTLQCSYRHPISSTVMADWIFFDQNRRTFAFLQSSYTMWIRGYLAEHINFASYLRNNSCFEIFLRRSLKVSMFPFQPFAEFNIYGISWCPLQKCFILILKLSFTVIASYSRVVFEKSLAITSYCKMCSRVTGRVYPACLCFGLVQDGKLWVRGVLLAKTTLLFTCFFVSTYWSCS